MSLFSNGRQKLVVLVYVHTHPIRQGVTSTYKFNGVVGNGYVCWDGGDFYLTLP